MSRAEFFGETSNHPGDSAPLQPRFGALGLLAFPKTKITFEREEISAISEIQATTTGLLMVTGRTVWGPKGPTLKGTEASFPCVKCFLYLVSSSRNVSIFHVTWLGTFWTDQVWFPFQLNYKCFRNVKSLASYSAVKTINICKILSYWSRIWKKSLMIK